MWLCLQCSNVHRVEFFFLFPFCQFVAWVAGELRLSMRRTIECPFAQEVLKFVRQKEVRTNFAWVGNLTGGPTKHLSPLLLLKNGRRTEGILSHFHLLPTFSKLKILTNF